MTIADNFERPGMSSDRDDASGLFLLDRELRIKGVSLGGTDVVNADEAGLMGRSIVDFIGLSDEMRGLQAELQGHDQVGRLSWQAELDGRRFHVHGFVDCLSAVQSERTILLTISRVEPASVSAQHKALPPAFTRERSWPARLEVFPGILVLLAVAILGFAISDGESRSVDEGFVDAEITARSNSIEPSGGGLPRAMTKDASIRRFAGQVLPAISVAGVAPLDGVITSISAPSFGVAVDRGDLLVTLDPGEDGDKTLREAKIALIEARSQLLKLENWSTGAEMREAERVLNEAEHSLKRIKIEHDRTKTLLDEGIIAANEYETAVEAVRSATLQMESAKARRDEVMAQANGEALEIAKERFGIAEAEYKSLQAAQQNQEIRAPISGLLLPAPSEDQQSSDLAVGLAIEKGASLFVIGGVDDLIVQTSVSEFDVDLIETGQAAKITSPARPDLHLAGEVVSIAQISSAFSEGSLETSNSVVPPARYELTMRILTEGPELQDGLRIGMTVDVEIDTAASLIAER